jgi:hypothetical protein
VTEGLYRHLKPPPPPLMLTTHPQGEIEPIGLERHNTLTTLSRPDRPDRGANTVRIPYDWDTFGARRFRGESLGYRAGAIPAGAVSGGLGEDGGAGRFALNTTLRAPSVAQLRSGLRIYCEFRPCATVSCPNRDDLAKRPRRRGTAALPMHAQLLLRARPAAGKG